MTMPKTEIRQLKHKLADFAADFEALEALLEVDVPSSLNKIRFITEKVLQSLCKTNGVSYGQAEPTLERMLGPLLAADFIPRNIGLHVRTIQMNTSPGSHYQESPLAESHVRIAQNALVEFLEWYCLQLEGPADNVQPKKATAPTRGRGVGKLGVMTIIFLCLACGILIAYVIFNKVQQSPLQVAGSDTQLLDSEKKKDVDKEKTTRTVPDKDEHKATDSPTKPPIQKADEKEIEVRITQHANDMGQVAVRTLLPQAQPGRTVVQSTKVSADGRTVEVLIRVEYESIYGKRDLSIRFTIADDLQLEGVDIRNDPQFTPESLRRVEAECRKIWTGSKRLPGP